MNDCVKKKANKQFNAIISNKNSTIVSVVKEPFFRTKLRSPNKLLIEYLNDDKTIDQICEWLLTESFCREKNYKPISQLIIRIFKEAPEKILSSFSTNQRLINRLQEFCKFERKYFLIGFGHFQQIIELLSFATRGAFLQNFTDLPNALMKCIDIISIRYLFFSLATNFTQAFGFSKDVVLKMIQEMNDSNQHHIILLLSKLSKEKNTYFAFDHSKVIFSLFEIIVSPSKNEFLMTQALQIIEYVKKNTIIKEKVDVILKYFEAKIDFDNLPVNFSTSIILKLYNSKFIPSLILLMINNPTHMFLHEGVMSSIESASDEVLIDFIEKNNVPAKLMWAMNVAKSNGFLTKFAVILNGKRNLSSYLQTPEWDSFVSNVLTRRLLILNNQFPPQILNTELSLSQKKGIKRSNSTQPKKCQQQQSNEKNKAKTDDEDENNKEQQQLTKKEEKKRKGKNQKSKNDQQSENKEENSNRAVKVKSDKIKNIQQNENKEGNLDKTEEEKVQTTNENNKSKNKSKSKNKNEEFSNSKHNQEKNIAKKSENSKKDEDAFTSNDENKNKNNTEEKANQSDQSHLEKIENDIFIETIIENKTEQDEEISSSNNHLPKILDSLLIKNLILQRMNQNENENNSISEKIDNSDNITENDNPIQSLDDEFAEKSKDKEEKTIEQNDNNIIDKNEPNSNDNSNNKEEIEENKELKNIEKTNQKNEIGSKNKNEIKSPSKNKNKNQGLNADSKIGSPRSNDRRSKNEQLKTPIKQAHAPYNYESSTHSNDHCRISLIKRKLYRNNEQSPQPMFPKDEKSKGRSYSVNWSPSSVQPNSNSKSDDPKESENIYKNSNFHRKKRKNASDLDDNDHSEIKKIDFANNNQENGASRNKKINDNQNKKIFDLGEDFSSSSDDDNCVNSLKPNIIGPSSNYFLNTIFGPAYFSMNNDENGSSSDSSDDEFEFRFTPIPKRFKRKSSFNYRGALVPIFSTNV